MEYSEEEIEIDDNSLEEEYRSDIQEPFNPTKIRIAQRTLSLDNLINRLKHGELDLSPDFQRNMGIWNEGAQSRLIESLLIRIPIPAFYFDATNDSKWLVIDGVQRLTALARFVIDEHILKERYQELKPLKLCDLEFLIDFNGKTFDELERTYQRRINETQVTVYTIEQGTPADVKYNIFKRINTGGLPLSRQEIRNALNVGAATKLLAKLAQSEAFQTVTDNSIQNKRGLDQEYILRFIALTLFPDAVDREYKQSEHDQFLNDTMAHINGMTLDQLDKLEKTFKEVMDAAYKIFGKSAFRRTHGGRYQPPINMGLFETWSVNLARLSEDDVSELIRKKGYLVNAFQDLLENPSFRQATMMLARYSTVKHRFQMVQELINKILQIQDPWENIEEKYPIGKIVRGQVIRIDHYRTRIEIETGVGGWIHPNELSWTTRYQDPSAILSVGDEIDVMILEIDFEEYSIWFSYKRTQLNPWERASLKYQVGSVVRGKIVKIVSYGAFAELEEGIEGLIHISHIASRRTEVEQVVTLGKEYDLKVIALDEKTRRINLSLMEDPKE